MDFKALQDEAELALRQANPLCAEANIFYDKCQRDSEHALLLWAKAEFFQEAFQSQLQIMGNAYILLNHTIRGAEESAKDSLSRLTRSDEALRALLDILQQTRLEDGRTLYSFVHEVDINSLQSQVLELTDKLKSGSHLTKLPAQVQREISSLRDTIPKLNSPDIVKDLNHACLSITTQVQDMAELLDSITRHYDLCSEARTLSDQMEIEQIGHVLQQDRLQLEDALNTLHAHYSLVENYHKMAHSAMVDLEQLIADFLIFFNKTDIFIQQKLRGYIDQLEERNTQLKTRTSNVERVIDEVNGLCEYYKLFQQGFAALGQEKKRRDKYQRQMTTLISEINSKMSQHYQRELSARTEFIQKYGEYLPNDIWDDLYEVPNLHVLRERSERGEARATEGISVADTAQVAHSAMYSSD